MKKNLLLVLCLMASLAAHSQYVYEDVINSERFGHLQLYNPSSVAIAPDGSIYLLEFTRNLIKVLNEDGSLQKVITLPDDVIFPYSISIDANGTLYVGAEGQVLVFNSNGNFLRAFGSFGSGDGQFIYAISIVIDSFRRVYVLDAYNFRVVVFDNQGNYLYQINNLGPNVSYSITIDQSANLYVADISSGEIKKFHDGQFVGMMVVAHPYSIDIDHDGNLVTLHFSNDNISGFYLPTLSRFSPQGNLISSLCGLDFENSNLDTHEFRYLFYYGNISAGNQDQVYLIDNFSNRLLKVNLETDEIIEIVRVDHTGQTNLPGDIEIDNAGNVYSVDEINDRIQTFEFNGNYKSELDLDVLGFGSLPYGYKIAIDQNDWKFVLKPNNTVSVYGDQNQLIQEWTFAGLTSTDLTVDNNNVYILISAENRINVFNKDGDFLRVINLLEPGALGPSRIDIDQFGNLIVVSYDHLQIYANDGTHVRNIGSPGSNLFNAIVAVAVDGTGNIYVAESTNIKILDSSDNLIQQIGETGRVGTGEGVFDKIEALAVSNDRLYVSDQYNNRIQIFSNLESPSLVMDNMTTNYIDSYFSVHASTDSQQPVTYQVVSGTAASFVSDQEVFLNHAGEVTIEATIEGTITHRKTKATAKLFIEKAQLTVTADNKARTYGDDNPNLTEQITGFRSDDDISDLDQLPVSTTLATPLSNAGTYDITPAGGTDLNYEFDYEPGQLTINKGSLYFLSNNISRTYGDENPELTTYYSGYRNSDSFSDLDNPPVITTNATIDSPPGEYVIGWSDGSDNNYEFIYDLGQLTIEKAPLIVMAEYSIRKYGEENPKFPVRFLGFKNGDTFSDLDTQPTIHINADITSPVGMYTIQVEGASDINYDVVCYSSELMIEQAPLIITAENKSKIYGDENPELTFHYEGFVNDEGISDLDIPPTIITFAERTSPVGEYLIRAYNTAVDKNYLVSHYTGVMTINKATLIAKAVDKSKVYKTVNPEFTIEYVGFKNNDDASNLNTKPSCSTTATQNSSVGKYAIVLQGGVATNYQFTFFNGQLTITKANQQISFGPLPSPVINTLPPFALPATSDSGLPVNYHVNSGPATIVAGVVTLSKELGLVTIEATQPGNENYNSATPVSRSFQVILDPVLGIDEDSESVKIYPNPAKEEVFIESPSVQLIEVFLVDAKGVKINLPNKSSNQEFSVSVSEVPAGLYILRIKTSLGQYLTRKISVVK